MKHIYNQTKSIKALCIVAAYVISIVVAGSSVTVNEDGTSTSNPLLVGLALLMLALSTVLALSIRADSKKKKKAAVQAEALRQEEARLLDLKRQEAKRKEFHAKDRTGTFTIPAGYALGSFEQVSTIVKGSNGFEGKDYIVMGSHIYLTHEAHALYPERAYVYVELESGITCPLGILDQALAEECLKDLGARYTLYGKVSRVEDTYSDSEESEITGKITITFNKPIFKEQKHE